MNAVFEHEVSVRWRDGDGLGHVNHAVFLTYLEEGRDAFYMRALGRDPHYVVARVEIDLRAEIRLADRRLQVRIEVERVGTTSLTTRETIVAEARVVTVLWDAAARKPVPFAADERTRLAVY
jgi:acyl-CoA thioester hydrolase